MEDTLESIVQGSKVLQDLGQDILSTLESDLDKLEDRIGKVLQDYLEVKLETNEQGGSSSKDSEAPQNKPPEKQSQPAVKEEKK
jgi:hypothetical protein